MNNAIEQINALTITWSCGLSWHLIKDVENSTKYQSTIVQFTKYYSTKNQISIQVESEDKGN